MLGGRTLGSVSSERLSILYVSQMPASPPRFGAQARVHGLMTQLARRHELTAAMLVDDEFDADECRRAMEAYCREVVLVPNRYGREGLTKRLLQLRSLASTRSFERLRVTLPTLQRALDRVLRTRRFDVVNAAAAAAWGVASMPGPTGASFGARSSAHTATPMASTCAARRTSGACSTKSPVSARRSFPTARTSNTTSRAPRTRRPTAEPLSFSGSSQPFRISTAWSTLCGISGLASLKRTPRRVARLLAAGRRRRSWRWPGPGSS